MVHSKNSGIRESEKPEKNYSAKVLESNHFRFIGTVMDPEDGDVCEWEYPHELYRAYENI